jgi:hypothetical protein
VQDPDRGRRARSETGRAEGVRPEQRHHDLRLPGRHQLRHGGPPRQRAERVIRRGPDP